MNTEHLDEPLSRNLQAIVDEVEETCGFSIEMKQGRLFGARGGLSHSPTSITLYFARYPVNPAVVAHELCHARRHFIQSAPMMRLKPERELKIKESAVAASEHLDNQLEHLVILEEMEVEFGFIKDSSHVARDLQECEDGIDDEFTRKCFLFLNWLLATRHFPEFKARLCALLKREGLEQNAQLLEASINAAGASKPRMVAALVDVLEIPRDEVLLIVRDPKTGSDRGALLDVVIAAEGNEPEEPI